MKVMIESTTKIVKVNGIDCRICEGTTERGIKIQCLIPRIAAMVGQDVTQFEAELQEQRPPSAEVEAWPLRMVL